VVVNNQPYLFDCGYGTFRALVQAQINFLTIAQIFLTHLHDDHVSDLAALIGHQWTRGRTMPTAVMGPYGTDALVTAALAFNAANARIRLADEGRTLMPESLFSGTVIAPAETPTKVYEDERVVVQSVENTHFTETTKANLPDRSLAYRIDSATRSVVFSGDTAYSDRVVQLAMNADILVCEAIDVVATKVAFDAMVAMGAYGDNPEGVWNHIVETHTPCEDAGKMATAANVKTLVLNHLVPGALNPNQMDQAYIDQVKPHYSGNIVISADQMVL
jgi:ribonuclease BN (tRNA processing enzyme)